MGGNTKEGEEEEEEVVEEGKEEEERETEGREREGRSRALLLQSTSVAHSPIWSNLRFPSAQIENIRPRLRSLFLACGGLVVVAVVVFVVVADVSPLVLL